MVHPLECPKLYRRCFRFAMSLCRRMSNRIEQAQELVQEAYTLAWRTREKYDPNRAPLWQWMFLHVRNAYILALRRIKKYHDFPLMVEFREYNEKGEEIEPDTGTAPRQENIIYLQERIAAERNIFTRYKIAQELEQNGEVPIRNFRLGVDGWLDQHRGVCAPVDSRKSDLWAKRQIARCDLRRARQDRAGARLAFA